MKKKEKKKKWRQIHTLNRKLSHKFANEYKIQIYIEILPINDYF